MKKITFALVLFFIVNAGLSALEVNKSELQSTDDTTIEFINYTGPHKIINSISDIKGMGSAL